MKLLLFAANDSRSTLESIHKSVDCQAYSRFCFTRHEGVALDRAILEHVFIVDNLRPLAKACCTG
jgi:hypothetical protein